MFDSDHLAEFAAVAWQIPGWPLLAEHLELGCGDRPPAAEDRRPGCVTPSTFPVGGAVDDVGV